MGQEIKEATGVAEAGVAEASKTEGTYQVSLAKKLGFWYLWAIAVGAVVGDGIFMLMGSRLR
ncbi:MAG: hypothetical protein ACP5KV_05000 [Candidatus Methanomethylicaceae archaeon]